jgi:hypothetical protein
MVRPARWSLWGPVVLIAGCIDVPALTFREVPPEDAAIDAAARADGTSRPPEDALPSVDAQAGSPDGPHDPRDAGPVPSDARPDPTDTRTGPQDAGHLVPADLAVLPADVAVLPADTAVLPADAGRPVGDAFAPPVDAAPPPADAFAPGLDGLAPAPDKGSLPGDAAVPDAVLPDAVLPDAASPDAAAPPDPDEPVVTFIPGPMPGGRFGASLAVVADQNGDGAADVVVGAPNEADLGGGTLYLLDGRTGATLEEVAGDENFIGFGSSLASLDLLGDGTLDVVVGSPQFENGRGRLDAFGLPGLTAKGDFNGEQPDGTFGHAMVPTLRADDRRTYILAVTAPGQAFSPRVYLMGAVEQAPGVFDLNRLARINLDPDWVDFGRAIAALPSLRNGDPDDFIVAAHGPLSGDGRIVRFNRSNADSLLSEYRPDAPTESAGAALAVLGAPSRLLFVGDPGHGAGRVSVFPVDEEEDVRPVRTVDGPAMGAGYGAALLAVPAWPPLSGGDAAVPVVCVGAPGDAATVGQVDCLRIQVGAGGMGAAPESVFGLQGPAGAAFGAVLAAAVAPDADGSWLLVVGAPDVSGGAAGVSGGVHLVRFPAAP